MRNLLYLIGCGIILITLLSMACASAGEPARPTAASGVKATPSPGNPWEELVKAAQKEGTVNLYGDILGGATVAIRQAFKEKFGIAVDSIEGRPTEITAKIMAERRAGLYLGDVGLYGITFVFEIKPLGITVPLSSLLVLPEVTDPNKWLNGRIPYLEKEGHALAMVAMANRPSIHNTDMVKEGEITSFLDYLEPKWKGKIALSDPSVGGSSPAFYTLMATQIFGMERTLEILRQLAAQKPVVTRNQRLLVEWVAQGKYPVGIGQSTSLLAEFKRLGAPVAFAKLKEPPFLGFGSGNIYVFDKAPHPNAAKLFLNWLLSKEGASIFAPAHGYPSLRVDVSTEGFDPMILPPPGSTLPNEDYFRVREEIGKIAGEIFALRE